MKKLFVLALLLAGCCKSDPKPDNFEVISEQRIRSSTSSDFTIMVIKDKKTEKEFKVIFNGSWGVTQSD